MLVTNKIFDELKLDKKFKAIAMDEDKEVFAHLVKPKQYYESFWANVSNMGASGKISLTNIFGNIFEWPSDDWHKCIVERKPDHSEWMGCLCWFWNLAESLGRIGYLSALVDQTHPFSTEQGSCWRHCRPLKPAEIEMYLERAKAVHNGK